MYPFTPFGTLTRPRPQLQSQSRPMQVSGAYPSSYYPAQSTGFDFSQMMNMFMPIMMMTMMLGMVGGIMGSTEESPSPAS